MERGNPGIGIAIANLVTRQPILEIVASQASPKKNRPLAYVESQPIVAYA